jgi:hypothetical protein
MVDDCGDGARAETAEGGELASADASILLEDVQATGVGAADPEQLGDELVDLVGGALVGADLLAETLKENLSTKFRCIHQSLSS